MTGSGEPRRGLDRGARALGLMCAGHEPCPGGAFSEFNEWTRVESRRETRTARGPSAEHRGLTVKSDTPTARLRSAARQRLPRLRT